MKTFNKTYLPDEVVYNGQVFKPNRQITTGMTLSGSSLNVVNEAIKSTGKKAVCVCVLPKNLKHRTDLHGKPYEPTKHIFTN